MASLMKHLKFAGIWIVAASVISGMAVAYLRQLRGIDLDAAAGAVSVALTMLYVCGRSAIILLNAAVENDHAQSEQPDPKLGAVMLPLAIAAVLAVALIVVLVATGFSAMAYSSLGLLWARMAAMRMIAALAMFLLGLLLFSFLYVACAVAWRHRSKVLGEIRQFRTVIESELHTAFVHGKRAA